MVSVPPALPEKDVGAVRLARDQVPCHALPPRSTVTLPVPVSRTTGVADPRTSLFLDGCFSTSCTTTVAAPCCFPVGSTSGFPSVVSRYSFRFASHTKETPAAGQRTVTEVHNFGALLNAECDAADTWVDPQPGSSLYGIVTATGNVLEDCQELGLA